MWKIRGDLASAGLTSCRFVHLFVFVARFAKGPGRTTSSHEGQPSEQSTSCGGCPEACHARETAACEHAHLFASSAGWFCLHVLRANVLNRRLAEAFFQRASQPIDVAQPKIFRRSMSLFWTCGFAEACCCC